MQAELAACRQPSEELRSAMCTKEAHATISTESECLCVDKEDARSFKCLWNYRQHRWDMAPFEHQFPRLVCRRNCKEITLRYPTNPTNLRLKGRRINHVVRGNGSPIPPLPYEPQEPKRRPKVQKKGSSGYRKNCLGRCSFSWKVRSERQCQPGGSSLTSILGRSCTISYTPTKLSETKNCPPAIQSFQQHASNQPP